MLNNFEFGQVVHEIAFKILLFLALVAIFVLEEPNHFYWIY